MISPKLGAQSTIPLCESMCPGTAIPMRFGVILFWLTCWMILVMACKVFDIPCCACEVACTLVFCRMPFGVTSAALIFVPPRSMAITQSSMFLIVSNHNRFVLIHDSLALKERALAEGFEWVGVCDASDPAMDVYDEWLGRGMHAGMRYMASQRDARGTVDSILPGAQSILMVGLSYAPSRETEDLLSEMDWKIARYALGRDYHKVIRKKLKRVVSWLEEAYPSVRSRICVDSAPLMEREFAVRAGLGWIGKNTCLIDSRRGSWFVLGGIVLSERFVPDERAVGSCGSCRRCIDACPTGALVLEEGQKVALLDSNRCISYLTIEHRGDFSEEQMEMLNGWLFGCDVCQSVCPFNEARVSQPLRSAAHSERDFIPRAALLKMKDLQDFMNLDESEFLERFAGTALMRAGFAGIRRNVEALLRRAKSPKTATKSSNDSLVH
jgi:epoxyqueuosine reductase